MNNPLLQLLVLAGIAIFLILRLRNVLGTRGGYEPPHVDAAMKTAEPSFGVMDFLNGAKSAYEMILMAFERGDLSDVRMFLAEPVAQAFQSVIDARAANGHTVTAQYIGTRETALTGAEYDPATGMAEVSVRFVGELIAATRDAAGNVVEGDPKAARKQRDTWTFARRMGQDDPNWQLVATG